MQILGGKSRKLLSGLSSNIILQNIFLFSEKFSKKFYDEAIFYLNFCARMEKRV